MVVTEVRLERKLSLINICIAAAKMKAMNGASGRRFSHIVFKSRSGPSWRAQGNKGNNGVDDNNGKGVNGASGAQIVSYCIQV